MFQPPGKAGAYFSCERRTDFSCFLLYNPEYRCWRRSNEARFTRCKTFNGKSGASGKGLVECLYRKQVYPHHTPHPMSPRQSQRLQTAEDQNSILWEVEHKRFWIQGLQIMEGMRVLWKKGEGWEKSTVAKTGEPVFNHRGHTRSGWWDIILGITLGIPASESRDKWCGP